DNGLELSLGLS
nr:Chain E, AFP homolog 2 [Arabidopsis thaliana]5C6V_F Chain F, AFP homolog 2 [Arabidopsis thaliana]5C6V_G Chain G, AFP homolog 2 [Arabidopsis thaliana]5C6V_H Chain H, AFP homolog 2 [Arabidopsis thaliana]